MTLDTASLRSTTGAIRGLRVAITAEGPETETFLQGQLSQDIAAMAPGDSRWSLLLQPQGKISAWLRATRLDNDRFLLDVDNGWADTVVERLTRFKLRTKCDLTVSDHQSLTIIGPGALDVEVSGGALELHDQVAGLPVVVVFGPDPQADVPEISRDVYDALRIEDGRPAMGSELDESTIPAAAGIVDQSVSFTKGCYTGQELVARVDSRGNNVPRRLAALVFADADVLRAGSEFTVDGAASGELTTVGVSAHLGVAVAFAYVGRGIDDGAQVDVDGRQATVTPLPLVGSAG